MKNIRKMAVACALCMGFGVANAAPVVEETASLLEESWKIRELSTRVLESVQLRDQYQAEFRSFFLKSREYARTLVKENRWEEFSDYYKTLDEHGKKGLEFVVEGIIEEAFTGDSEKQIRADRAEEYFPGYGYGKPGYVYRRGEETGREFLQAYWKDEEIEEMTSLDKELLIEIKLYAQLKADLGELVKKIGNATLDVNGEIHEVVKIKIQKSVKIHTKQKRKIGVEKVWFKLYEAKKKWFGDLEWKLVGRTFQNHTGPTGEAVITEAQVVQ